MFDINALVNSAIQAAVQEATQRLQERIDALEVQVRLRELDVTIPADLTDEAKCAEALNRQEWFWEKLGGFIDGRTAEAFVKIEERLDELEGEDDGPITRARVDSWIESAISDHCGDYDHDSYDNAAEKVNEIDTDELVTTGDLADQVEEALRRSLRNATVSISI